MTIHYQQKLYGVNRNGGIKVWSITVTDTPEGFGVITALHGIKGGKMAVNEKTVRKGKNIGKSNSTTPIEQAVSQAKSTEQKKRDSGYADTVELAKTQELPFFKPMTAASFDKQGKKIKFPCYIQPKLDGCRCIAKMRDDGSIVLWSRGLKEFHTLDHIKEELKNILKPGEAVDGEIYVHGWTFQRITKAIKKLREDTLELQYHIYDFVNDKTFQERFTLLVDRIVMASLNDPETPLPKSDHFKVLDLNASFKSSKSIHLVTTRRAKSHQDLVFFEKNFVERDYEGIMARNADGLYINHRSNDLQKVKRFEDAEFTIVDFKGGVGKEEGCAIFRVVTDKGLEFDVRPKGNITERRLMYRKAPLLVGSPLTVKFQGLTDDGIPRFPVGIKLRDNWDLEV